MLRLPWRAAPFAGMLAAIIVYGAILRAAPARTDSALPPDLVAFLEEARRALQNGDSAALARLADSPDVFQWLDPRLRRGRSDWQLTALPLPTPPAFAQHPAHPGAKGKNKRTQPPYTAPRSPSPTYLAVFYAFHMCESIGDHFHPLVKKNGQWRFGREILETDTRGYRIRDHNLTVRYDLPESACFITDEVLIERLGPAHVPCFLRLSGDLHVTEVTYHGKPFPVQHVPGLIAFLPPKEPRFTLSLTYSGTVNRPGSDYIHEKEAVLTSYWYPHIGRLPAKSTVTAIVPNGWTAIGQGELVRRLERENETIFTYRHEIPVCFFSLVAGPYQITTRLVNGRKLSICQLRPNEDRANRALDTLARALEFFERTLGPFPYTHYELVETLGPFGGALEAYSFSTYASGAFGAVVHELAHTWWGGLVPCTYTRSMWNESFAVYSEGLFQRLTRAEKPARALTNMHRDAERGRRYLQTFAVPMSQAHDTGNFGHNPVGYGKGALILAMLEDALDTETMIRCMRRFLRDHRPGEAAEWRDFQRAVEKTTGKDYAWFFNQWVYRGGVPQLRLTDVRQHQEGGQFTVTARIIQEGKPYRLRVPVALETEGGEMVTKEVEVHGADTLFQIHSMSTPLALHLDPGGYILMAGTRTNEEGADPFVHTFAGVEDRGSR